jgi:hypothetical protein
MSVEVEFKSGKKIATIVCDWCGNMMKQPLTDKEEKEEKGNDHFCENCKDVAEEFE